MTQELRKLAEDLLFTGRYGYESEEQASKRRVARDKEASIAMFELLDRLEKAEKALKVAADALSLALSDVDWRKDSPTQPVIHKAYEKAMEASK